MIYNSRHLFSTVQHQLSNGAERVDFCFVNDGDLLMDQGRNQYAISYTFFRKDLEAFAAAESILVSVDQFGLSFGPDAKHPSAKVWRANSATGQLALLKLYQVVDPIPSNSPAVSNRFVGQTWLDSYRLEKRYLILCRDNKGREWAIGSNTHYDTLELLPVGAHFFSPFARFCRFGRYPNRYNELFTRLLKCLRQQVEASDPALCFKQVLIYRAQIKKRRGEVMLKRSRTINLIGTGVTPGNSDLDATEVCVVSEEAAPWEEGVRPVVLPM